MVRATSILALALALAGVNAGHTKSTQEGIFCKAALSKYNFGNCAAGDAICLCRVDTYCASYTQCLSTLTPNDEAHAMDGLRYALESCNGQGHHAAGHKMSKGMKMVTVDTFLDAYEANMDKFVNASDITNKTAMVTTPLLFTPEEAGWSSKDGAAYRYQLYTGTLYGGIVLCYWAAVMAIAIAINFLRYLSPKLFLSFNSPALVKLRQYLVLPATFGFRHSTTTFLGAIPTRPQSLVLFGYLVVNVVVSCVHYVYSETSSDSQLLQILQRVADRTGMISFVHFPIVFLFAGRNNFLLWLTGWSYDTFNAYHRWTSRGMVAHAVAHSVAWTIYSCTSGSYRAMFHVPYYVWGIAATVLGCAMLFQSMRFLRAKYYEVFLVLHVVFAIAFTVACVWHSYYMGWMEWIWAAVGIWAFDRFARMGKIALNGLLFAQARAYSDEYNENTVFKMAISTTQQHKFQPGHHVFLHVLRPWGFWQSHPFTVYRSPVPGHEAQLMLCAKACNGTTRSIANRLKALPNRLDEQLLVALDGPYGQTHHLEHYDSVVFIAGGIGVTANYSYASDLIARAKFAVEEKKNRIVFVWVVSDVSALDWFAPELEFLRDSPHCALELYITGSAGGAGQHAATPSFSSSTSASVEKYTAPADLETKAAQHVVRVDSDAADKVSGRADAVYRGRPDVAALVSQHALTNSGAGTATAVMVCGPPTMNDAVRKATAEGLSQAQGRVDFFEEAFSW